MKIIYNYKLISSQILIFCAPTETSYQLFGNNKLIMYQLNTVCIFILINTKLNSTLPELSCGFTLVQCTYDCVGHYYKLSCRSGGTLQVGWCFSIEWWIFVTLLIGGQGVSGAEGLVLCRLPCTSASPALRWCWSHWNRVLLNGAYEGELVLPKPHSVPASNIFIALPLLYIVMIKDDIWTVACWHGWLYMPSF